MNKTYFSVLVDVLCVQQAKSNYSQTDRKPSKTTNKDYPHISDEGSLKPALTANIT